MAEKLGRNDKCPCGSGKKYKHCCLPKDETARRVAAPKANSSAKPAPWIGEDEDDIDELSNHVNDLIRAGKLVDAEAGLQTLQTRYPGMIDRFERLGQLREAQGRLAEAAEAYSHAADFAATHEGFDRTGIDWYRAQSARLHAGSQ